MTPDDSTDKQSNPTAIANERFGSSWLESLGEALKGLEIPEAADGAVQVKVSGHVGGGPLLFRIAVKAGRVSVTAGRFRNREAVLTWKSDDFASAWRGELSLEEAYMTGQMKIEGDRVLLIDGWRPLRTSPELQAALKTVRSKTSP